MRRFISVLMVMIIVVLSVPVSQVSVGAATTYLYVSPKGDDSNSGSLTKPLKTLDGARKRVAELKASGAVTVYFREGEYPVNSTVKFTQEDSGTESAPVTYKAYGNEEVTFTGCETLPASTISPVTEEDTDAYGNRIFDRVLSEEAKSKLMKIDLSSYRGELEIAGNRGWQMDPPKVGEVYVDNEILGESRWPNDEEFNGMFKTQEGTAYRTFVYDDPTNHTSLWNQQAVLDGGLYANGWFGTYWYCNVYKIESLDTTEKKATAMKPITPYSSRFNPGFPAYFYNLIEEIDMPGESYIDRERKIAYFYPATEITEDSKVRISTLKSNMISVSGASYINFEGLNFKYTVYTPIDISDSRNITIDGCVIAHTSDLGASMSGYNLKMSNCHVYDTAYGGVHTNGGDRSTLTPCNNEIVNNIFHNNDRLDHCYCPSIKATFNTVGLKISHNLIYNTHHEAIAFDYECNDIEVSYNEIHHAVKESGDMGSIYWGRDPSVLGIKIMYNYFHHNGNPYNNGFNQSIFGDDGNTGAYIYGNIFYQGTLTTENGGTEGRSFAVKTNGGQFYNVQNNIFIDSPTAANFQEWNGDLESPYQGEYITYNYSQWSKVRDFVDNEVWKEHYAGTQWDCFFDIFKKEYYDKWRTSKSAERKEFVAQLAPAQTNTFKNNVAIDIDNAGIVNGSANAKMSNNYYDNNEYLPNGEAIFKDFDNQDFRLTEKGLAMIKRTAPEFQEIPFEDMGIQGDVDGRAPAVTNAELKHDGDAHRVVYTFTDPDGDTEGHTKYEWYVSNSASGNYTRIYGLGDKDADLSAYEGKYIKVKITPHDVRTRYGEEVTTAPLLIEDVQYTYSKEALRTAIDTAKKILSSASVGDEIGSYPESAYNSLSDAIKTAESKLAEELNKYQIRSGAAVLDEAVKTFESSKNVIPGPFTIKFDVNSGIGQVSDVTVKYGASVTVPSQGISKEGYILSGWSDSMYGDVLYIPGESFKPSKDMTLYAVWEEISAISVKSWDGASVVIESDREAAGKIVVFASYKDGKLLDVKTKRVDLSEGDNTVTCEGLNTADASVKIIVLNNLVQLVPLCVNYK